MKNVEGSGAFCLHSKNIRNLALKSDKNNSFIAFNANDSIENDQNEWIFYQQFSANSIIFANEYYHGSTLYHCLSLLAIAPFPVVKQYTKTKSPAYITGEYLIFNLYKPETRVLNSLQHS